MKDLRKEYGLDELEEEPWEIDMEKKLLRTTFPDSLQDKLAKEYFHLWKGKAYKPPTVVVHDDLHPDNLLFEEDELVGVLDFGDTNLGTPEQEFRQLYRINETVLGAALHEYGRLSGKILDIENSKIWAIAQELAVYSGRLEDPGHPSFARAVGNLQKWLPEGEWSSRR